MTTITSSDGLNLEAEFDDVERPRVALVVCHAHPGMQGTMRSPLLLAVRDELVARGCSVLRFNFRGVGESEGEFGLGLDEVSDARGAIAAARERYPGAPVALMGWSFGGAVALRTATYEDVRTCVAIAPSVTPRPEISAGLPPGDELGIDCPVLVVVGANDDVVSPAECKRWAGQAGARYVEIAAANHFFWAKYEPVVEAVADFIDEQLETEG
jgi:uncharacterized protein